MWKPRFAVSSDSEEAAMMASAGIAHLFCNFCFDGHFYINASREARRSLMTPDSAIGDTERRLTAAGFAFIRHA
jgi:hypothetical protein